MEAASFRDAQYLEGIPIVTRPGFFYNRKTLRGFLRKNNIPVTPATAKRLFGLLRREVARLQRETDDWLKFMDLRLPGIGLVSPVQRSLEGFCFLGSTETEWKQAMEIPVGRYRNVFKRKHLNDDPLYEYDRHTLRAILSVHRRHRGCKRMPNTHASQSVLQAVMRYDAASLAQKKPQAHPLGLLVAEAQGKRRAST